MKTNITEAQREALASTGHEINRIFCEASGDRSQVPWSSAQAADREATFAGVDRFLAGVTPKDEHEGWAKNKRAGGWVHGAVKDATAKTHPDLVPYEELNPVARAKDALRIAAMMAAALGIE